MAVFRRVYAEGHPYFITMTTQNRTPLLVDHVELLREAFRNSKKYFVYEIDSIVILPDHPHMIIIPEEPDSYPKIVRSVKTYFSKGLKESWAGMPTLQMLMIDQKEYPAPPNYAIMTVFCHKGLLCKQLTTRRHAII